MDCNSKNTKSVAFFSVEVDQTFMKVRTKSLKVT